MAKKNDENKDPTFTIINKNTVERLKREGKVDVPAKKVDVPKDKRWNEKQMGSKILQGIQNGDSVQKMAESMKDVVGNNANSAVRQVRTMVTSAECNGRLDSFRSLAARGVVLKKVWIATPDHRTRESHLEIDGQEAEIEERFGNGCMYPGDAKAAPEEVWNCRCSMRSHILGVRLPDGSIEYTGIERDETSHDRQMDAEKDRREKEAGNKGVKKPVSKSANKETEGMSPEEKYRYYSKKALKDLSDYEQSAIYEGVYDFDKDRSIAVGYVQNDSSIDINWKLREGERLSNAENETVKALDKAIANNPLKEPIKVRRGVNDDYLATVLNADPHDLKGLSKKANSYKGTEITDKGFMSTTLNGMINKFRQGRGNDVYLELSAPKGMPAFFASNSAEGEVIFGRGTTYVITDIKITDDNKVIIKGDLIWKEKGDNHGNKKKPKSR